MTAKCAAARGAGSAVEGLVGEPREPLPSHAVLLAAAPERALPEFNDKEAERVERQTVCRHRIRTPTEQLMSAWSAYFGHGTPVLAYRAVDAYVMTVCGTSSAGDTM